MESQLQNLIEKIRSDGIAEGQKQSQEIQGKAQEQAKQILRQAKEEAFRIINEASDEAKRTEEARRLGFHSQTETPQLTAILNQLLKR